MYQALGLAVVFNVRLNENGRCTLEELDKKQLEQTLLFQQSLNEKKEEKLDTRYQYQKGPIFNEKLLGFPIRGESELIKTFLLPKKIYKVQN